MRRDWVVGERLPVYAIDYSFEMDGKGYQGRSYGTGVQYKIEEGIEVEFPAGHPEWSRIRGLRTNVFGPIALMVLIFPLVGFTFICFGFRGGQKAIRLLGEGKMAWGLLQKKEATSTRVNKQTVYNLTFFFTDDRGIRHTVEARTHRTHLLEDDQRELLVYDPHHPAEATLLDHLQGSPKIDRDGQITVSGSVLLTIFLPGLSILGHGWYCLKLFLDILISK